MCVPSSSLSIRELIRSHRGPRLPVRSSSSLPRTSLTPLFRPDYAKIGNFRADFPKVPIMALTASATPKVQDDMSALPSPLISPTDPPHSVAELGLNLQFLMKVVHSFNRMNLFYEVRPPLPSSPR